MADQDVLRIIVEESATGGSGSGGGANSPSGRGFPGGTNPYGVPRPYPPNRMPNYPGSPYGQAGLPPPNAPGAPGIPGGGAGGIGAGGAGLPPIGQNPGLPGVPPAASSLAGNLAIAAAAATAFKLALDLLRNRVESFAHKIEDYGPNTSMGFARAEMSDIRARLKADRDVGKDLAKFIEQQGRTGAAWTGTEAQWSKLLTRILMPIEKASEQIARFLEAILIGLNKIGEWYDKFIEFIRPILQFLEDILNKILDILTLGMAAPIRMVVNALVPPAPGAAAGPNPFGIFGAGPGFGPAPGPAVPAPGVAPLGV
jgi:hypothetical protein